MHCERHILSSLYRRQVYGALVNLAAIQRRCIAARFMAPARVAWVHALPVPARGYLR